MVLRLSRAFLGLILSVSAASPSAASTVDLDPVDLAEAIRFRQEHSLPSSPETVQSIAKAFPLSSFGVPLTPEEEAAVIDRNEMMDMAANLLAAVYAAPEKFAGARLNHSDGGFVEVFATSAADSAVDDLESLAMGARVRFTSVDRSLAELRQTADQVIHDIPTLAREGIDVQGVGVTIPRNSVEIAVARASQSTSDALLQRYGPAIHIAEKAFGDIACTSALNCTPWRGGIYITGPMGCTSGFIARPSGAGTTRYVLTAGHCNSGVWKHNGVTIGQTSLNTLTGVSFPNSDAQRITITGSSISSPYNRIYVSPYETSRSITATRPSYQHYYGMTVCASGKASGYRCGTVLDEQYYHSVGGHGMYSTLMSFSSTGGDSGGPSFLSNTAWGIVSQAGGGDTLVSPINLVTGNLGTRLCLNSSCS